MTEIATLKSTLTMRPLEMTSAPSPIHRAIDCLTIALLEVQIARRQLASGRHLMHPMRDDALVTVEAHIQRLGEILLEIRGDQVRV